MLEIVSKRRIHSFKYKGQHVSIWNVELSNGEVCHYVRFRKLWYYIPNIAKDLRDYIFYAETVIDERGGVRKNDN